MKLTVFHRSDTRGHAFHGWLDARHTFSFADYFDPTRIRFGELRVLNDDSIAPGAGFGTHPHENMEIVTIPLEGALEHKDSMGNGAVIRKGQIQVMSAGTGVLHSEFNPSRDEFSKLLQIWIFTAKKNAQPRYEDHSFLPLPKNALKQIVSPDPSDEGSWIHQDAWFHYGCLDRGASLEYEIRKPGNGVYVFVIEGSLDVGGTAMADRDGAGFVSEGSGLFAGKERLAFWAKSRSEFVVIEVPVR